MPDGFEGHVLRVTGFIWLAVVGLLALVLPASGAEAIYTTDPDWFSDLDKCTATVVLGDVDGDGDLDLVCGNFGNNSLYLNEAGRLSTKPAWLSESVASTRNIVLGDVDGDGDLDLVCGDFGEGAKLHLYDGNVFSMSPDWQSDSLYTVCLALGDVDGDGDLDLVCGNVDESNALYLNHGGVFSSNPDWSSETTENTEGVVLGDVDGDSDLDLVCGNFGLQNTLYLNDGGTFSASPVWLSNWDASTVNVDLGDVDGDGDLDLVCGNMEQENTLYLNEGGTFLTDPAWSSEQVNQTHGVVLGDVDRDGDLDLVCGNNGQSNNVYLNEGGVFPQTPDCSTDPSAPTLSIALGDIDGDGNLDLVCGNCGYPNRSNTLYLNRLPGIQANPSWSSAPRRSTHSIALGDVDGDRDLDLVCGNETYSSNMYLNQGSVFSTSPDWSSELIRTVLGIALGDLDGDGDLDLVWGNWDKRNMVFLNDEGVFSTSPDWTSESTNLTTCVALGDMDGDDDLDLVCGNHGQSNELYLNDGDTLSSSPVWSSGPANPTESVALGDIDGDGDLDLVCGNDGQSNTLYLNHGGALSEEPDWSSGPPKHTLGVVLGDVDGDGDLDLVCGNTGQSNTLYINEGGVLSTSPGWWSGPANSTESVALGDIDGDGDLDLVCGNDGQSNTLYLNEGGVLSVSPEWLSGSVNSTEGVVLADIDGDGDLDLVCGNRGQSNTLYKGARNPAFQGDPAAPTNHLPNNDAFLQSVRVEKLYINMYEITLNVVDVESDPVWIVPEYQFEGVPEWHPADIDGYTGNIGLLQTSPEGEQHVVYWDVTHLPFDSRDVILRLRSVSIPLRVGSIQGISSYSKEIGPIEPQRPEIAPSTTLISFPTVTAGDTASSQISILNEGNELLTVTDIELPSAEMMCDLVPPHDVDPGDSISLALYIAPRTETSISGDLDIMSSDPVTPISSVQIETDIRELAIESRLLTPVPEVPLGEALTVIVTPAPEVNIERGFLYHRPSNTETFSDSIALSRSADDFIAVIPGEGVTEAGLDYYIKVENSGIFATDPPEAPADSIFYQAVASPAAITVTPHPNSGPDFLEGREITVFVSLPDGTEFVEGTLHFRMGGESIYQALALQKAEPLPPVAIPDSLVGPRGLEYWVDVRTLTTSITYPVANPSGSPAVIRVTVPDLSETALSPANEYRMVTVPLDFGVDFTGTLEALLSDQGAFGPYDRVRWRCFRYLPALGDYAELSDEYSGEFRPVPGRGLWLISSSANRVSTAPVRGLSTSTDSMYSVVLEPGWNQIGNPFVFPVAWDSIRVDTLTMAEAESVIVEPLVRWEIGEGYRYGVEILEPFEGYWVKNLGEEPVVLRVPPWEAGAEATQASVAGQVSVDVGEIASAAFVRGESWQIEIRASCEDALDFDNYVGVVPGAATEWDRYDRSEPPMNPGRAVSLYFPHQTWGKHPGRYAHDIRGGYEALALPPLSTTQLENALSDDKLWGQVWSFDVAKSFAQQGVADDVRLEFARIGDVPHEASVYLIDKRLRCVTNLRHETTYSFYLGEKRVVSEEHARFMLLVGSEQFIDSCEDDLPNLPARTALHYNYPNPFSASTIIRYDLAHGGVISLRIYDAGGALVKVLYEGSREPGCYEVAWMGDNETGHRAAAGIYFCSLSTGAGFKQTRKLLLVK